MVMLPNGVPAKEKRRRRNGNGVPTHRKKQKEGMGIVFLHTGRYEGGNMNGVSTHRKMKDRME